MPGTSSPCSWIGFLGCPQSGLDPALCSFSDILTCYTTGLKLCFGSSSISSSSIVYPIVGDAISSVWSQSLEISIPYLIFPLLFHQVLFIYHLDFCLMGGSSSYFHFGFPNLSFLVCALGLITLLMVNLAEAQAGPLNPSLKSLKRLSVHCLQSQVETCVCDI